LKKDDVALTAEQCADVALKVLTGSGYGNGNIVETMLAGRGQEPSVREVPVENLYPTGGPLEQLQNAMAAEKKMMAHVAENGMRS
jgi:hypothetical protein